jgi:hypothetical protein
MPTAKHSRRVRGKKKSTASPSKRNVSVRTASKRRSTRAARLSRKKVAEARWIQQYHELVDKKLLGTATPKDSSDLEQIKLKLGAIVDEHTSGFQAAVERRHSELMEKLTTLTDELRRLPSASSAQ